MKELKILEQRVERLRKVHLRAIAAFHAFEQLQEYRASNLLGRELAHKHAEAIAAYKGFFNTTEYALNTELHIAVARLFDSHKDSLHIEKLVNYAEQNQVRLTVVQTDNLDEDVQASNELAKVYAGLSKDSLKAIKSKLDVFSDAIRRLKEVRDKEVAHTDLQESDNMEHLTYQEFYDLINLSEEILNLISHKFYGDVAWFDSYKDTVIEDTRALLRLVGKSEGIYESN